MSNLNISTAGQPIDTRGLKVRELKDNIQLDDALKATQGNGMDEAFVEADGKRYVIYSDDNFKLDSKASISIDGKAAKVLKLSNEINSFSEGISYVPSKAYDIAKSALKPVKFVAPNATTSLAIMAGLGAGAISRNAFSPTAGVLFNSYGGFSEKGLVLAITSSLAAAAAGGKLGNSIGTSLRISDADIVGTGTGAIMGAAAAGATLAALENPLSEAGGIGIAAGAVMGIASATAAADQSSKSTTAKQVRAWSTGIGSVAVGATMPEIFNLVSKIQIPELAVKGGKIAATAALVGGGLATVGLAAAGALKSAKADTIDQIAK